MVPPPSCTNRFCSTLDDFERSTHSCCLWHTETIRHGLQRHATRRGHRESRVTTRIFDAFCFMAPSTSIFPDTRHLSSREKVSYEIRYASSYVLVVPEDPGHRILLKPQKRYHFPGSPGIQITTQRTSTLKSSHILGLMIPIHLGLESDGVAEEVVGNREDMAIARAIYVCPSRRTQMRMFQ